MSTTLLSSLVPVSKPVQCPAMRDIKIREDGMYKPTNTPRPPMSGFKIDLLHARAGLITTRSRGSMATTQTRLSFTQKYLGLRIASKRWRRSNSLVARYSSCVNLEMATSSMMMNATMMTSQSASVLEPGIAFRSGGLTGAASAKERRPRSLNKVSQHITLVGIYNKSRKFAYLQWRHSTSL